MMVDSDDDDQGGQVIIPETQTQIAPGHPQYSQYYGDGGALASVGKSSRGEGGAVGSKRTGGEGGPVPLKRTTTVRAPGNAAKGSVDMAEDRRQFLLDAAEAWDLGRELENDAIEAQKHTDAKGLMAQIELEEIELTQRHHAEQMALDAKKAALEPKVAEANAFFEEQAKKAAKHDTMADNLYRKARGQSPV